MSNENTSRSMSVKLGAAFLMATSAIGPGFLTQTSQFTAKYMASFAFVIVCVIIMDCVAQSNIWSIIGVSGTVTTMTALAMGLTEYDHTAVDGARCTLEDAYAVDNRFLHMPREERLTYKTIHPGRVDVVGGGALVWNRVLAKVSEAAYEDHGQRIDSFMASEHGLLDGIVLDYGKRLLAAR